MRKIVIAEGGMKEKCDKGCCCDHCHHFEFKPDQMLWWPAQPHVSYVPFAHNRRNKRAKNYFTQNHMEAHSHR